MDYICQHIKAATEILSWVVLLDGKHVTSTLNILLHQATQETFPKQYTIYHILKSTVLCHLHRSTSCEH